MNLDEVQCWARLAGARHAVLATVHPRRGVDAVPVVFAVVGRGGAKTTVVVPVDRVKSKRSLRLQRLANIAADARCVLLVDHYEDEWSHLWWVRVHARAVVSHPPAEVVALLASRYPRYREPGTVVAIMTLEPTAVSGWCSEPSAGT